MLAEAAPGRVPAGTTRAALLPWHLVVRYPHGASYDDVKFAPSIRVPGGWKFATALQLLPGNRAEGAAEFETVSLTTLVDSPLLTGAFFKTYDLAPGQKTAHRLNIAADSIAAPALTNHEW